MIVYHLFYNFIELSLHCWTYIKCITLLTVTNNVRMTTFQMLTFAQSWDQLVCIEELKEHSGHCHTVLRKGHSDLNAYHKFTRAFSPPEWAATLSAFIFVGEKKISWSVNTSWINKGEGEGESVWRVPAHCWRWSCLCGCKIVENNAQHNAWYTKLIFLIIVPCIGHRYRLWLCINLWARHQPEPDECQAIETYHNWNQIVSCRDLWEFLHCTVHVLCPGLVLKPLETLTVGLGTFSVPLEPWSLCHFNFAL